MMHMYVSFMAGLIISMPYIIWEVWRFVVPALHKKEKKHSRGAVFVISLLFSVGVFFAYFTGLINPHSVSLTANMEALLAGILGGIQTLFGYFW